MKYYFLSLFLLLALDASAQSDVKEVYVCVDEKGHRSYTNTGNTKSCKKVELPGLTTIAAPPAQAKRNVNATNTTAGSKANSPSDFPKVDDATQKARDNDRKQILLDEMRNEEQKLANLKRDYNDGLPERNGDEKNFVKYQDRVAKMKDDISRVEKNVEALKRELSTIR